MSDLFDKGIKLSSGFSLGAKSPLDTREVVEDISERDALITSNIAYEGMIVYVKTEKKHYKLVNLTTPKWEELGSGSGGDLSDYQKIDEDTLTTNDKTIPGAIYELDAEIGNATHYEKDDTNTGLIVVADGTLTDNTTEIEEKDVLGIAAVGEYVKLVNATGINKILEDTDDRLNKIETVKNADFKQAIIDEVLDGVQPKYVTQAEYDSLSDVDKNNPKIEYHITDAPIVEYQLKTDNTLTTTDKTTTGAINELDAEIGDLSTLKTTDKTSIVDSMNELFDDKVNTTDVVDNLTSTDIDKPLSANQGKVLKDEIGDLNDLTTTNQNDLVSAINEHDIEIGDLTQLKTTNQTSLVESTNELVDEIGDKREFTPKHYELDNATGVYEVVADNAEPFDELTQVKLTDANKNNESTPFVVGDKVNLVDEVTTKPASGVFKYIDNAILSAQLSGEEVDLSGYQEKQDDALKTNDKTVTGAINQLVDILTVAPTYVEPTLALTANPSTLKQEVGTKITPILSYTFTQNDAGAETSHTFSPVDSETQAQLTIVEGDNIEYSVTVNYGAGTQKADNFGNLSGEAIQAGSLTKTLKYVGYRKNFYVADAGTVAPTDSAEVRALTSFSTGTQRINVAPNSQRIVVACPSTKTLTSAKYVEQGNAEYKDNFTLTTVQVSGATDGVDLINYNVYTYVFAIPNSAAMTFNISIA